MGNGSSLKGAKLGSKIDSHKYVLRFNFCQVTEEHAEDVGLKWTHYSTGFVAPNPQLEGPNSPRIKKVYWISLDSHDMHRKGLIRKYKSITTKMPGDYTLQLKALGPPGYSPTSGLRILYWRFLLHGQMKRESVFGFDFFENRGSGKDIHYWPSGRRQPPAQHYPNFERELFQELTV